MAGLVPVARAAAALIAAALWASAALAQHEQRELSPADSKAWLGRIHSAAIQRNYQGTLVFSAGGSVSSSRVAHYCDGSQRYERVEALDGQARRVLRHNETVFTLWPERRAAVVEQREAMTPFPGLLTAGADQLVEHYTVHLQGSDRVAGFEAQVLWVRPRDGLRFGQRLWAEKQTGLLLRADILGERDDVLESSSFSEVAIDVRPQPETVLKPMRKLDGYRVVRAAPSRTVLEQEGWTLTPPVAGFRQISCVKRSLAAPGADAEREGDVVQAIFSDGLTHVSLFIEPYRADRHTRALHTAIGATHTLMRRHGEWWVTVMGDVPVTTLKMFAAALERRR